MRTNSATEWHPFHQRQLTTTTTTLRSSRSNVDNTSSNGDEVDDWRTPLLLSFLAGLSTCLGAAIVFCAERRNQHQQQTNGQQTSSQHHRVLGHGHLAFALSLAGSVMITVSVASILPECFANIVGVGVDDDNHNPYTENSGAVDHHPREPPVFVAFGSALFLERCLAFAIGCGLYLVLSKCAFPEPDAILNWDGGTTASSGTTLAVVQDAEAQSNLLLASTCDSDSGTSSSNNNTSTTTTTTSAVYRKRQGVYTPASQGDLVATNAPTGEDGLRLRNNSSEDMQALDTIHLNNSEDKAKSEITRRRNSGCGIAGVRQRLRIWAQWLGGSDLAPQNIEARRAWRVAMLLFVSLTVHNFPEGLAVAASTMHSQRLGITTTVAIALHNIPEGIAIAIPCLAARPDAPWLAFGLASLSGLAEPLGATMSLALLRRSHPTTAKDRTVNTNATKSTSLAYSFATVDHELPLPVGTSTRSQEDVGDMRNVLAFVAGIMIAVAVVELFPEAKRHMKGNRTPGIVGAATGVIVMLASDAYLDSS